MPRRLSRLLMVTTILVCGLVTAMVATGRLTMETRLIWSGPPEAEEATTAAEAELEDATTPADEGSADPGPATALAVATPDEVSTSTPRVETPAPPPERSSAPEATDAAEDARAPLPASAAPSPDDPAGPAAVPSDEEERGPPAPELDVVRVAPDGSTVVAGRALPDAEVELLLDGVAVARTTADGRGFFAIVAAIGPLERPGTLQARVAGASGTTPGIATVAAAPAEYASRDIAAEGDEPAGALSAPVIVLPTLDEGADAAAPTLVEAGETAVTLRTPDALPQRMILDTVSYSVAGDAVARGRAPGGVTIRVYVNNRAVGDTTVPEDGAWQIALPREEAETAQLLRFDEIGPRGEVINRLETRFSYDEEDGPLTVNNRSIVIERGDNLWRIAENVYGDGLRYSLIFGANSDLIRDPDLIYPDQVFVVPELTPEGWAETGPPAE